MKMKLRAFIPLFILLVAASGLRAQSTRDFSGIPVSDDAYQLDRFFTSYELYQMPVAAIDAWLHGEGNHREMVLDLPEIAQWTMHLYPNDLRAPGYVLRSPEGRQRSDKTITFMGHIGQGGRSEVRIAVQDPYLSVYVRTLEGEELYLEPVFRFAEGADRNVFVAYRKKDVIERADNGCMAIEAEQFMQRNAPVKPGDDTEQEELQGEAAPMMNCFEIEVATAHDKAMFDKYGSVASCEGHAFSIMNLIAVNFDNEFANEIQFYISEQFVETSNPNFPTGSTNAGQVLQAFRSWGNNGGFFGNSYDLGQLWTNRDFQGGTIGIAYVDAVCGSFGYHALQDFSNNQNLLRVLTAHEIGHNLGCNHDASGSPFIMAPSVNNSNQWSNPSISAVNNSVPAYGCFSSCSVAAPPVANFNANNTSGCAPLTVQFFDQSQNNPTNWFWTFPGGTPSTSSDENPVVTYFDEGVYDVSLTVTNGGGTDQITFTNYITVEGVPLTDFDYIDNQLNVEFFNLTANATLLTWDFGDGTSPITGAPGQTIPGGTHGGRTTGTFNNPTHQYLQDGFYPVVLTAENPCGIHQQTQAVQVVSPVSADFTSNVQSGCPVLTVDFESMASANTTQWSWTFPGGTPASSTAENPTVQYSTPGTYQVTLQVQNTRYQDVEVKTGYITVLAGPTADFDYAVNNKTVNFTNTTQNGNVVFWDFGDGTISNNNNPTHTYAVDSIYTVMLVTQNACGMDTAFAEVEVGVPPTAGFAANPTEGCAPLNVQFINQSSPNASHFYWSFEGGNPSTSVEESPNVLYNQAGSFKVSLVAYNGLGEDSVVLQDYIVIEPLPEADFSESRNGRVVNFVNQSQDATSYLWDFGDGQFSSEENPFHEYAMDGSYTVILEATNDCGVDSYELQIDITTPPEAAFSASVTEGCAPLEVQFTNNSTANAENFEWSFPGGEPESSTEENPVVTYTEAGSYNVSLIVSNAQFSDTLLLQNLIVVNDLPVAGFNASVSGAEVQFSDASIRGDSYTWDFGDGGLSQEMSPVHQYAANGSYSVTLIVENECGTDSFSQEIIIDAYPVAGFNADMQTGCAPLSVQFAAQAENYESLEWSFEGGNPASSTEEAPQVVYEEPGVYQVMLVAGNALGRDSLVELAYIEVLADPTAEFDFAINAYTVSFSNTSQNASSYAWDFGDGNTDIVPAPRHTYEEPGVYTVQLIAEGLCGADTISYEVEIIDQTPVVSIAMNQNTGCVPMTVSFMDQSTNEPTAWNWSFEGGNPASSNAQNPVVEYTEAGVYRVSLEVSNQFGTSKEVYDSLITVLPLPESAFDLVQLADTVWLTNTSMHYDSLRWDFGDGTGSTEENPVHVYENNGVYTVVLTVFGPCGSSRKEVEVVVDLSSVVGLEELGTVELFPNPNPGQFTLRVTGMNTEGDVVLEIRDILGRAITQQIVDTYALRAGYRLDGLGLRAGSYILVLRKDNRLSTISFIVME